MRRTNNQIVIYTIEGKTIIKFIILDFFTGTAIFYIVKYITTSKLLAMIGSMVGTEGVKRTKTLSQYTVRWITAVRHRAKKARTKTDDVNSESQVPLT